MLKGKNLNLYINKFRWVCFVYRDFDSKDVFDEKETSLCK